MSYFLIASILVAIIAVIYVWYVTRGLNSIPDDKPVPLETDDDKLLVHWYKLNIKHSFDFNVNDTDIALKYLKRVYDLDVDPSFIILGSDLDSQYYKLTNKHLTTLTHDISNNSHDIDIIVDLRSEIGKSGEIAIIYNHYIRKLLQRNNTCDLTDLGLIINSDLDIIANNYLKEVLKFRWDQINQLNDPNVLNNSGSFLYIDSYDHTKDYLINNPCLIFDGKISAMMTSKGARINLLCSNYEFEALIKRWKNLLMSRTTLGTNNI